MQRAVTNVIKTQYIE